MAKKRLIFSLFHDNGGYMLSRNFRLQRAGNLGWLTTNYNFKKVSCYIDELVILDVTRSGRDTLKFCEQIKAISKECFIPIAAGGGVSSLEIARQIIGSGADKLVVNSALFDSPGFVKDLVSVYGSQCVVASIDVKAERQELRVYTNNGSRRLDSSFSEVISSVLALGVGELYVTSIDKDGTGQGYLFEILDWLGDAAKIPVILAGGAGNWHHLCEGLKNTKVDAAATGNLFNFIGNGFPSARLKLLESGIDLARWNSSEFGALHNCLGVGVKAG